MVSKRAEANELIKYLYFKWKLVQGSKIAAYLSVRIRWDEHKLNSGKMIEES